MKNVVISGGTSGIGRQLVHLFLDEGHNVVTFSRNKKKLNKLFNEVKNFPGKLSCMQCDVSKPEQIKKISIKLKKDLKTVHYLINNSGTNSLGTIDKIKLNDWKKIIDVNLTGPFYLTQCLFSALRKNSIVLNMGSIASKTGFPNWSAYCSSKFGLKGFTESLREELRPKGVRVIHAEVGATNTAIWDDLGDGWNKDSMMNEKEVALVIFGNLKLKNTVNIDEFTLMPPAGIL